MEHPETPERLDHAGQEGEEDRPSGAVTGPRAGRRLTRAQFEEVMRRASQMAEGPDGGDGTGDQTFSDEEVVRIGAEVGLSELNVRRALAEVRSARPPAGALERILGPGTATAARVVPGTPEEIGQKVDRFLVAGQLLENVRFTPGYLVYRPALDWASKLARAASSSSRSYYLSSSEQVEVRLTPVGEAHTSVELEVAPGLRSGYVATAAISGVSIGALAVVGTVLALTAGPLPLGPTIALGAWIGGGLVAGVTWLVGRAHRRKLEEVRMEMEGALDRLENRGDLEPPPPSWRQWVKRHFHGVARDLRGSSGDDEGERP